MQSEIKFNNISQNTYKHFINFQNDPCDQCNQKSCSKTHLRTHTNISYKLNFFFNSCDQCHLKFKPKADLTNHEKSIKEILMLSSHNYLFTIYLNFYCIFCITYVDLPTITSLLITPLLPKLAPLKFPTRTSQHLVFQLPKIVSFLVHVYVFQHYLLRVLM